MQLVLQSSSCTLSEHMYMALMQRRDNSVFEADKLQHQNSTTLKQ